MSQPSQTNPAQMEQRFNILPHPARSNNPADLIDSGLGLIGDPAILAHHAGGPYLPSQNIMNKLDAPLSREELQKRSEELNK